MRTRDPAAKSSLEVLLCYPGLHAVWLHVFVAAPLYRRWPLAGRLASHVARFLTGVELHPAAELGRRVTIDHGAGVVVGETAELGDDVHLYHGVTLGGDDPRPVKRHPTVGDGATLGANATLLGDIRVGADASVGAGSVVTSDVPAGATVAGVPAERVDENGGRVGENKESAGTDWEQGDEDAEQGDENAERGDKDAEQSGDEEQGDKRGQGERASGAASGRPSSG